MVTLITLLFHGKKNKMLIAKKITSFIILLTISFGVMAHNKNLTFQKAIDMAYKNNPRIQSQIAQIQHAQGQVIQSTRPPNPSISIEFENIAGTGAYNNFNSAESTFTIQQPIPLGGRLKAQGQAALKYQLKEQASLESIKSSLYRKVGKAYIDLLYAQRWTAVANKLVNINEKVAHSIRMRMNAGASSKVDLNLAQTAFGESKITRSRAIRKQAVLKRVLVNLIGRPIKKNFLAIDSGIPHDLLSWRIISEKARNSNIQNTQTALIAANKSRILSDKKQAWPNLNAGVGIRRFSGTNDKALVASLSMKIPIFDYNQGNVKSAQSTFSKSVSDLKKIVLTMNSQLRANYLNAIQYQDESTIVKKDLLPSAKITVQLARKGYESGRYTYIELANAMRVLLSEEKHYIESHAKLDKALVNINGLLLNTFRNQYAK